MKKSDLKFVFFGGSPLAEIVLPILKGAGYTPTLIITSPDRPQGRNMTLTPPPAKVWANENDIDVVQPENITPEYIDELGNTEWHLFIVAAYGAILPKPLLDLPQHGTLNLHPSLLPKLRGPSPIRSAILSEDHTGITIMLVDEKMDHGPIVAQARVETDQWPLSASTLTELLATEGGKLLAEVIEPWVEDSITPEEQDDAEATFCKKFTKADGELDLSAEPYENYKKYLALEGWPGTYFFAERDGKRIRVKITKASYQDDNFVIECVVPEGKPEMSYRDFTRNTL